jgi:hypothetical protein
MNATALITVSEASSTMMFETRIKTHTQVRDYFAVNGSLEATKAYLGN